MKSLRPELRAVLWDMDGTLADTFPGILDTFNAVLARFGAAPIPMTTLKARLGPTEEGMLAELLPEQPYERVAAELAREVDSGGPLACHAEMLDLLEACRGAGFQQGVYTGAGRTYGRARLRRLGLEPLVEAFVTADDVARTKPAPDGLLELCRRIGVEPSRALYVGDSHLDVACAVAAGLPVIGVTWGVASRESLAAAGEPHAIVDSPAELANLLGVGRRS